MSILIRSLEGFLKSRVVWMVIEWVARFLSIRQRCGADHAEFVICDHTIDITFVRLAHKFVYLAVIMDVFTRRICGWHLSHSLDQSLTLHALQMALQAATPVIHHSEQCGQYAATAYVALLTQAKVAISMAEVGEAWQNGYAERLIRTIKEEEVDLSDYQDFHDAYQQIRRFLTDVTNRKRIHSRLGYLTPAEFEASLPQQPLVVAIVP